MRILTTDSILSTTKERVQEVAGLTTFLRRDSSRLALKLRVDMTMGMMTGLMHIRKAGLLLFMASEETLRIRCVGLLKQDSEWLKVAIVMPCKGLKILGRMLRK